jgi:hypothetical protein
MNMDDTIISLKQKINDQVSGEPVAGWVLAAIEMVMTWCAQPHPNRREMAKLAIKALRFAADDIEKGL